MKRTIRKLLGAGDLSACGYDKVTGSYKYDVG